MWPTGLFRDIRFLQAVCTLIVSLLIVLGDVSLPINSSSVVLFIAASVACSQRLSHATCCTLVIVVVRLAVL